VYTKHQYLSADRYLGTLRDVGREEQGIPFVGLQTSLSGVLSAAARPQAIAGRPLTRRRVTFLVQLRPPGVGRRLNL